MTNKEEALQYIKTIARQKIASKEEIDAAYQAGIAADDVLAKKIGIAQILYCTGVMVILLGVTIF